MGHEVKFGMYIYICIYKRFGRVRCGAWSREHKFNHSCVVHKVVQVALVANATISQAP